MPTRSATPNLLLTNGRGKSILRLLGLLVFLPLLAFAETARPNAVFIGDSLTAGFGLDPDEAYPALIQKKIDEAGLTWRVVNAGVSGDTTAGGLRRLDWILRQPSALILIELGANDGLRGIAPEVTQDNLRKIIARIREKQPATIIVLAGMQVPGNMGPEHVEKFKAIYPALARECNVALIPFLLQDVGGIARLNQADGIHPTAEGQVILANNVWAVLEPLLRAVPAGAKP